MWFIANIAKRHRGSTTRLIHGTIPLLLLVGLCISYPPHTHRTPISQALEQRTFVVAAPNGTGTYRIYAADLEKDQMVEWTTSDADLGMCSMSE